MDALLEAPTAAANDEAALELLPLGPVAPYPTGSAQPTGRAVLGQCTDHQRSRGDVAAACAAQRRSAEPPSVGGPGSPRRRAEQLRPGAGPSHRRARPGQVAVGPARRTSPKGHPRVCKRQAVTAPAASCLARGLSASIEPPPHSCMWRPLLPARNAAVGEPFHSNGGSQVTKAVAEQHYVPHRGQNSRVGTVMSASNKELMD